MKAKVSIINSGILLSGKWLNETGFSPNTIVSIEKCDKGFIMLKACGKGMNAYDRMVKAAHTHGLKLVKVLKGYIQLNKEHWLEEWGFSKDSLLDVAYEHGYIYIKCNVT